MDGSVGHTHTQAHTRTHTHTHAHTHVCARIHAHAHTDTHTHICLPSRSGISASRITDTCNAPWILPRMQRDVSGRKTSRGLTAHVTRVTLRPGRGMCAFQIQPSCPGRGVAVPALVRLEVCDWVRPVSHGKNCICGGHAREHLRFFLLMTKFLSLSSMEANFIRQSHFLLLSQGIRRCFHEKKRLEFIKFQKKNPRETNWNCSNTHLSKSADTRFKRAQTRNRFF